MASWKQDQGGGKEAHPIGIGAKAEEELGAHLGGDLGVGGDDGGRSGRLELRGVQRVERTHINGDV